MKSFRPLVILALFSASAFMFLMTACSPSKSLDRTRKKIERTLGHQTGTFAVSFRDMSTGRELLIRETESFHAASTMKTPVMVEVFKMVKEGKISLHDSIWVRNQFSSIVDGSPYCLHASGDSDQELFEWIGKKKTLDTLLFRMITRSSNLATNLIMDLVGAPEVTKTMRSLGAPYIQVRRGVEDSLAFVAGLNNTTTALDLLNIYGHIASGTAVDSSASLAMSEILFRQHFNDIIPARLPEGVRVAHKTGSIQGVLHDSGIVILPSGRKYVLVILSKGLTHEPEARKAMAKVSRFVYDFVVMENGRPVSGRRH